MLKCPFGECGYGAGGQGFAKKEALYDLAGSGAQKIELRLSLDALGNNLQAQAVAHGDDGFGYRHIVAIFADIRDK